ncbi:MAG: Fic family protein [Spirochaetota bacterium]|nr:Fic family protein [Spirochaetota bacterium]
MSFNPDTFKLPLLLPRITKFDLETKEILKKCAEANRYLGELKGECKSIPNTGVLVRTLALREAQKSSEIENIFTTQEQLYKEIVSDTIKNPNDKEIINYFEAITYGFTSVLKKKVLSLNVIKNIQAKVKENDQGFRKNTVEIQNEKGETIYIPPTDIMYMQELLTELEIYTNTPEKHDVHTLVKMAIIHYQFESIHPFTDGNGRVGRMINVLYLILNNLLYTPILYLSRYIVETKSQYYSGLQNIRETKDTNKEEMAWQTYINYILDGVIQTAKDDLAMVRSISILMIRAKKLIKEEWQLKFYSHELINHLFEHPYTRIEYMQKALNIKTRKTASEYLNTLVDKGFLVLEKKGRSKFYINTSFWDLLCSKK